MLICLEAISFGAEFVELLQVKGMKQPNGFTHRSNDHPYTRSPASKHANDRIERADSQQGWNHVETNCHMEDFSVVVQRIARAVEGAERV